MHDELYSDAVRDIFIIRWYIFIKFYLAISSRSPSPWMSCADRWLVFNWEWPWKMCDDNNDDDDDDFDSDENYSNEDIILTMNKNTKFIPNERPEFKLFLTCITAEKNKKGKNWGEKKRKKKNERNLTSLFFVIIRFFISPRLL